MSTVEKLLVQIFERKNSIIEQVKQQTDLYSQHLASKLLIEGITPPPWLWNTSLSSNLKELNKDELISEILLPRAWPSTYYPNSRYSIYNTTVVTGDNGELSDGAFVENYASSKDLHAGEGPSSRAVYHDNNTEDVLKSIPELDVRVTLPQDETDTRAESTSYAPDQSLAKIQRSKSRQKALKLRNSASTKARSQSSIKCRYDVTSIGIDFSASVSEQVGESYKFPEASMLVSEGNGLPAERNCPNQENQNDNYTGRVTRSTSCSIKRNCMSDYSKADNYSDIAENVMSSQKNMHAVASNGTNMSMLPFEQENLVNKSPKVSEPCMINTEPYAVQESSEGDHQMLEKGVDVYTGGVTRSRSSAKQQNYVYDSFEVNSSSDIANKNSGGQAQPTVDLPNQSVKVVNLSDITDESQDVCNATVRGSSYKKKKLTGIYSGRTTRSMSSTQKCSITSETLQVDASTYSAKVNSNIIAQTSRETLEKLVDAKKHLELVQPSIDFDNRSSKPQCCSGNEVITNLDKISSIARASDSGTKSAALQKSACENQDIQSASHDNIILTGPEKCDADNQLGNAEADSSKSHIPQSSPSETNGRIGSEHLVAELPSDCSMLMKPKQLNFDDMEECNLNEYIHCTSEDENLDIAIKEIGSTPIDRFSLKEKLSSSSPHTIFSEKQSTLEQDIYSKSNRLSSCPVEFTAQEPDRSKIDASDTEVHASKSSLDDPEALQCFENSNISPEEDTMLPSTFNNSDANHHHMKLSPIERSNSLIEPYVEVGVSGFKRCDEGTAASCAGKSKTLVTPCSTSLTNRTTGDYKKCVAKEVANEDPITGSFAAGGQNYIQGAGVDDENFSLESKEIQIAMNSSLLERKFRSTKVSSWPQVKRRKLEDQQSNCFSASRNSQIPRLCNIKMASGSIDLHSIEGQGGVVLKEDASGDNIISELCPTMDSCVPGLDLTLIASQDCMVEEKGRGDPVDLTFDADGCYKPNEQEDAATTSNDGILQVLSESKGTVGDFCDSITEVKGRDVPEDPGDSMFDTAGCYKPNEQADAATISNAGILQGLSESKETVGDFCDSIIEVKGRNVPADPGDSTFDTDGWYKRNEQSDAATISNDGILQVSSESKETVGNFCDSIIEVKGRDVPAGPNFDSCEYSNEQNFQTASMLENNISLANNESLCTGSIVLKSSSHMMEDSLYPHSLVHSSHDEVESTGIDDSMPVFEGFVIDPPGADGELDIAGVGINFEALDLPTTTIERASILEQICRSASTHKSLSHLSSALKLHRSHTLYQSLPEGLEHMDLRSTSPFSEDIDKQSRASTSCDEEEVGYSAQGISYPDCLGYSGAKFRWKSGSPYASPVGKLWERTSFHSSSSEKQLNSNPELTCFPIKEDSTISEENENVDKLADEFQDDIDSLVGNSHAKRQPLFDVTAEACLNAPASVSAAEKVQAGGRMDSAKSDVGFSGTRNKAKRKLPSHCRNTSVGKENRSLLISATGKKKEKHSHIDGSRKPNSSATTSLRRNEQKLSEKGYNRHNNIISNVTSFIPLVQQKQAASMCTGKKDIKVKALEAAEAAKRLEEKKEIERKKRKEAMKLKRAQLEQENLRQLELNKQKKEEERKKKDAEVLAKKRARAEEEKNDKEKKRKRIEDLRRQQNDQEEKLRARKLEIEKKCSAIDEKAISMKENDDKLNISHVEKEIGDCKASDKPVGELRQVEILKSDNPVSTISHECLDTSADHSQHEKVIHSNLDKPGKDQNFTAKEPQLKSYEISPYKCSDDEDDEDEEDQPMRKFIPSWASKSCVALVLPLQQEIDPDSIFSPESFCSMDEVLLPRRVQQKQTAL
ncbi:uncharacterized protein LOC116011018 [Ipomoea triloba]|uniref:uncharacterized protein LOC116011018 n=1 Tax=Ipomoea triloba TaxID=35885 RepID=UPI00125E4A8F|nr:uncharacterized protein LOC116011018 [Ipomoea triloba]